MFKKKILSLSLVVGATVTGFAINESMNDVNSVLVVSATEENRTALQNIDHYQQEETLAAANFEQQKSNKRIKKAIKQPLQKPRETLADIDKTEQTSTIEPETASVDVTPYPIDDTESHQQAVFVIKEIIADNKHYNARGNEDFQVKRQWVDSLGQKHTQFEQTIDGIKVYGAGISIHSQSEATSLIELAQNGEINDLVTSDADHGVTGILAVSSEQANALREDTSVGAEQSQLRKQSRETVMSYASAIGDVKGEPELAYVYLPSKDETRLSWKIEVAYRNDNGFQSDIQFYDVANFSLLTAHPQVFHAKYLKTYDLNYAEQQKTNRTLKCQGATGNEYCGITPATRAHKGASTVYDYYKSKFNRDSVDNAGLMLISNVRMGESNGQGADNAYWYLGNMWYGAGNNQGDWTADFDIIGHELTHGVTEKTAGLIYKDESGALNEAWSDILGISAEAYKNGTTQPNWSLGGDVIPGGLRQMNDPTKDGSSKDWYPSRYTGTQDQGGVHWNSGIANLAYVLLVDGGKHPRAMSTVQVPKLGLAQSEKIFYRALNTYFNASTNFSGARTGTAKAAQDLYGSDAKLAVETAWCAVGVGSCPTATISLTNNGKLTNISANKGVEYSYTLEVPAGATDLVFTTTGSTGDADLFVKFGSAASASVNDCKSTTATSNEVCRIANVQAGTYHVTLQAYSQISGVSLVGRYTEKVVSTLKPIDVSATNISVPNKAWKRFTYKIEAGYANLTIAISGGTGDVDLYVTYGKQSTLTSSDCAPYLQGNNETCKFNNPDAGTWYIDMYGYQAAYGVKISLTATP